MTNNQLPSLDEMGEVSGIPTWGGGKTPVGERVKGRILDATVTQQTNTKFEPLFFPDGKPRSQVVVTFQTQLRDPEIEDDDGIRRFFAKGGAVQTDEWANAGQPGLNCLKEAAAKAGVKLSQLVGCELDIKKGGSGKPNNAPQGPNLYKCIITPGTPPGAVDIDDM